MGLFWIVHVPMALPMVREALLGACPGLVCPCRLHECVFFFQVFQNVVHFAASVWGPRLAGWAGLAWPEKLWLGSRLKKCCFSFKSLLKSWSF